MSQQSITHPAISAAVLIGVDKQYIPRDPNMMKRGLYQFGSSFVGNSLENIARNVAPTTDSMYLKTLAVGAAYITLCSFG